jgi:hypothetical protein
MKAKEDAAAVCARAESLLESIKGIARARVSADDSGRIVSVWLEPAGIDERAAIRNAQSALMAVMGAQLSPDVFTVAGSETNAPAAAATKPVVAPGIVSIKGGRGELHEAARAAFDALRAAQSGLHAFQFDGAELVRINARQYVVVVVRHAGNDVRHCGSAPVSDSVATASARALMHAVSLAAMTASTEEAGAAYRAVNA